MVNEEEKNYIPPPQRSFLERLGTSIQNVGKTKMPKLGKEVRAGNGVTINANGDIAVPGERMELTDEDLDVLNSANVEADRDYTMERSESFSHDMNESVTMDAGIIQDVHWSQDPTLTDEGREAAKLAELRDLALSENDLSDLQTDENELSI